MVESLEEEIKRHRELRQNLDSKIMPLKVCKNHNLFIIYIIP